MSATPSNADSFRAAENRARRDERRNDELLQDQLARLNELLEADPLDLGADAGAPRRPTVFVTGLPRSGTTLLMQVLAAGLDVAYPDCVVARFWRAPSYGLALSRHLARGPRTFTFESDHGTPASTFEPHEFSYFFHRWFDPATPEAPVDWDGFVAALGRLEHTAAQPLLLKGLVPQGHLVELARRLERAVFVDVTRDPIETMASLLAARRRYYGDERTWWSMRPRAPQPMETAETTPEASVAGQVHALRRELDAELAQLPAHRVVRTSYTELCADPRSVAARVADAGALTRRTPCGLPPSFASRRPSEAESRFESLLGAYRSIDPDFAPAWEPEPVPCVPVRRSAADAERVAAVVRSGRLMTGERVECLEAALSERLGGRAVACVSSGMAALRMLISTLEHAPVTIPSFTCEALALAAAWDERRVELLDVDPETMNLSPGTTVSGILVVPHAFGFPAPIHDLRADTIIEDAALALGSRLDGVPCGALADLAVLSFYATKPTGGACGGAVVARDPAVAAEIRDLRQYNHRANYRRRFAFALSDMDAELALASVERLEHDLARRRAIAQHYDEALALHGARRPRSAPGADPNHGRYVVHAAAADDLVAALRTVGVGARREMTHGLHHLLRHHGRFPGTDRLCGEVIALPMSADLTDAEVDRVIHGISRALPVE